MLCCMFIGYMCGHHNESIFFAAVHKSDLICSNVIREGTNGRPSLWQHIKENAVQTCIMMRDIINLHTALEKLW